MSERIKDLSKQELAAVHKMASKGLRHALFSLSQITGHSFGMHAPSVSAVSLEHLPEVVGPGDQVVVAIYMSIDGDVRGHLAFLFPWHSAQRLWDLVVGHYPHDPQTVDDLCASAMLETGNILNSGFMNALSLMTNLRIHATPPLVSIDDAHSIASAITCQTELGDSVALAMETKIFDEANDGISGYFLCIPTGKGLHALLTGLDVRESA
ncbi:MAG TPA: chemotaxis protein CheC [Fimbriimonadaceae bacterium]|nr:chemotaxis protein CheC [Fimbriimonadaceae bacterium]